MTVVFIENVFGSGQVIRVLEEFGESVVEHTLQPGDNARIAVSRFKSIKVDEGAVDIRDQTRGAHLDSCSV